MSIYERDYEREPGGWGGGDWRPGGGPRGFASWSANGKLLAVLGAVYLLQLGTFTERPVAGMPGAFERVSLATEWLELPASWLSEPWRAYGLVTYALTHDPGGIYHLLFNGIALFFFGRTMEGRLGGREYLAFFFAGSVFAGFVWTVAQLASGGAGASLIGASGGIAAILILFAFCYPNVQVYLMGVLPVPAWLMAVLFVGQDVLGAIQRSDNVAYTAHLGGALFGYLYFRNGWRVASWLPEALGGTPAEGGWSESSYSNLGGGNSGGGGWGKLFSSRPKLQIHRGDEEDDDAPEADPAEDRVDEILRKIQAEGQDSLTREEKRFLQRASRRYQRRRD